jgi:hypothetical protein
MLADRQGPVEAVSSLPLLNTVVPMFKLCVVANGGQFSYGVVKVLGVAKELETGSEGDPAVVTFDARAILFVCNPASVGPRRMNSDCEEPHLRCTFGSTV